MAPPYVYVYPPGTAPPASQRPRGVIVDPCFCVPNVKDLEIELKFSDRWNVTTRDFVIKDKDVNETPLFRVKEPKLRVSGEKTLLDYCGDAILTMRPTGMPFVINTRWQVFRGESKEQSDLLYTVQLKGLWKLDVFLADNEEQRRWDFQIRASRLQFDRKCLIYSNDSDTIVADMHQEHTPKSLLLARDIISLRVNPNVDYAFIASLIIIFDDLNWTYFDKLRFTGRVVTLGATLPFDMMRKGFDIISKIF